MPPLVNTVQQFGGIVPKTAPHLLPPGGAQVAQNSKLFSGALRPWMSPLPVTATLKSGTIQSIFLYEGEYWLNWITDVDVVRSPIGDDMYKRIYWTGDVEPRMSVLGTVNSAAPYPSAYYKLGIPAPTHAPTVAVVGNTGDPQYREKRAYTYTFVSNFGEEGPPAPVSAIVDWYAAGGTSTPPLTVDNTVNVTAMDGAPTGNYYITSINIYRTNTGSTETDYQFVQNIPIAQATAGINDSVADAALGEIMPSATWDPPPSDLKGLISLPCGALAGFHGNEICFSELYLPHAWPVEYRMSFEWQIVSVKVYGTSVLVMTEGFPYLLTGIPGSLSREKLQVGHPCVSKRGVVDMGYGVMYPSPDGLVLAGVMTLDLVTKNHVTRDEWKAFTPSSITGCYYNGLYFGFYNDGNGNSGGFTFDPINMVFATLDTYATAAFRDVLTDNMYFVTQANTVSTLQQWDAGATPMSYTWRSKTFYNPHPLNLGVVQVLADDYDNLNIEILADGVSKYSGAVLNDDAFHIPAGYRAHRYEFILTGTSKVNFVFLGDVMSSVAAV